MSSRRLGSCGGVSAWRKRRARKSPGLPAAAGRSGRPRAGRREKETLPDRRGRLVRAAGTIRDGKVRGKGDSGAAPGEHLQTGRPGGADAFRIFYPSSFVKPAFNQKIRRAAIRGEARRPGGAFRGETPSLRKGPRRLSLKAAGWLESREGEWGQAGKRKVRRTLEAAFARAARGRSGA